MFKKIVSNLPFNPGLTHQLSFYAKRLHQEESIRRTGLIFTILAIGVQMLAVLVPAQTSLATSQNDIIYGATTKEAIVNALSSGQDTAGRTDIRQIYDYYGITLADIEATSTTPCDLIGGGGCVRSQHDHDYITTGRGDSPGVDKPTPIPGTGTTIYERSLKVWDINNAENFYPFITGRATGEGLLKGRQFWILLKGCGNITFESFPQNPALEITKTKIGSGTYKIGDVFNYRIEFRDNGTGPAYDVSITDNLVPEFEFVEQSSSIPSYFKQDGAQLQWWFGAIQPGSNWQSILLKVRIKAISEATKQACNASTLTSSNGGTVATSNPDSDRCVTIDNACPGSGAPIPAGGGIEKCPFTCPDGTVLTYDRQNECPNPVATCEYLKIIDKPAWNKRTYEAKFVLSSTAHLNKAVLKIDGNTVEDFGSIDETKVVTYTHTFNADGNYNAQATAEAKSGTAFTNGPACEVAETISQPYTHIGLKKGVSNITQNIPDANNTTAKANDILEYTLTVSNTGNADATNYIIDSDALNDVLEYADMNNYDGANYDKINQRLTWPAVTVPANGNVVKKFKVKVKSVIPTTPPSVSDPLSYDFRMRNVFGNAVVVLLDKPIPAKIYGATVSKTIPNTGPGSSLLISFFAVMIIGYFYARSRLLTKEVGIIRNELGSGV